MSKLVLDPWDLEREQEEQDMDIDDLRENMSWTDDGLPSLDFEDTADYIDVRYR
ncbi:hypothetical protein HC928_02225 [bacterium]|nr:hypothetical protein [bacterium]